MWTLSGAVGVLSVTTVLTALTLVWGRYLPGPLSGSLGLSLLLSLAVVAAVVFCGVMPLVRLRTHRWELTEDALYSRHGFVTRRNVIAPLVQVQSVQVMQNPFERLFGLASVHASTAAFHSGLWIGYIEEQDANDLADLVRSVIAARGAGQTAGVETSGAEVSA